MLHHEYAKPDFYFILPVRKVFAIFCGWNACKAISIHPTEQAAEKRLRQILLEKGKKYSRSIREYMKMERLQGIRPPVAEKEPICLCCCDRKDTFGSFCRDCWMELCLGLIPSPGRITSKHSHIPKNMGMRRVNNHEIDDE